MRKFLGFSICILAILIGVLLIKSYFPGILGQGSKVGKTSLTEASSEELTAASEEEEPYTEEIIERDISYGDTDPEEASGVPEDSQEEETREILPEFNEILSVNPYVSGWLKINDTLIDQPVVYTPKSQNYFLHRALDGSSSESGTLFIANIWREGYHNTLIYGHNMKDGGGFGSLSKYASEDYGRSHAVIEFDTLFEKREYELLGVFYSAIDEEELETDELRKERDREIEEESIERKEEEEASKEASEEAEEEPSEATEEAPLPEETPSEEPVVLTLEDLHLDEDFGDIDVYREEKDQDMEKGEFRYYYYTDLTYKEDYDYFLENVKNDSLYDTGVEAEWGDELLTLSTCSYHTKNGRFVVVAKRK